MGARDASDDARDQAVGGYRGAAYATLAVVVGAGFGVPLAFFALRDLTGAARIAVFVAAVVLGGFVGGLLAGASPPSRRADRAASRRHARDHS
jgi:hypothetical protein